MLDSPLLRQSARRFLGGGETEIVDRSNHFFLRLKAEGDRVVKRLLVVAPDGYTGVERSLLNVHPEARMVKLKILGKIAEGKKGYRPLVDEVRFLFSSQRDIPTIDRLPYARFSDEYCRAELKSWRSWFYAVKKDGWGNFHCLENLSSEWVVVLVEKHLNDQKDVALEAAFQGLEGGEREASQEFVSLVRELGDRFFDAPGAGALISRIPPARLADLCFLLLNLQETGRHEPCTAFATLLKLARVDKKMMEAKIAGAAEMGLAPYYYLEDLQRKLVRF